MRELNQEEIEQSTAKFEKILTLGEMNGAEKLHGGLLMTWMDDTAAVCARRFAHGDVTTAAVQSIRFMLPAFHNETISIQAQVCSVGNTSMDVYVTAMTQRPNREDYFIADGHFILVAIDENGKKRSLEIQ